MKVFTIVFAFVVVVTVVEAHPGLIKDVVHDVAQLVRDIIPSQIRVRLTILHEDAVKLRKDIIKGTGLGNLDVLYTKIAAQLDDFIKSLNATINAKAPVNGSIRVA